MAKFRTDNKGFVFRVYDRRTGKIYHPSFLCFDDTTHEVSYAACVEKDGSPIDIDSKDMVLDQFTGFRTKISGIPIYEHDVLEFYYLGDTMRGMVVYNSEEHGFVAVSTEEPHTVISYLNKFFLSDSKARVVGHVCSVMHLS